MSQQLVIVGGLDSVEKAAQAAGVSELPEVGMKSSAFKRHYRADMICRNSLREGGSQKEYLLG